jgi:hypothetical protein
MLASMLAFFLKEIGNPSSFAMSKGVDIVVTMGEALATPSEWFCDGCDACVI